MKKPILFLIFNRPDTTKQVFEAIRKYKPKQLFIAADGPRNKGESEICKETRSVVSNIDWDCDVKTLFREENLGCRDAVSSSIDWFFQNVESGIILEDDCLPNQSFFRFCEEMLKMYRNNKKIKHINGTNYLEEFREEIEGKYFFSRLFFVWGWATWRDRWLKYDKDFNINKFNNYKIDQKNNLILKLFHKTNIKYNIHLVKTNTWGVQWSSKCFAENGISCTPVKNLIRNIGEEGTHTSGDSTFVNKKTHMENFDTIEKKNEIKSNLKLDKIQYKRIGLLKHIVSYHMYFIPIKIKRFVKKHD